MFPKTFKICTANCKTIVSDIQCLHFLNNIHSEAKTSFETEGWQLHYDISLNSPNCEKDLHMGPEKENSDIFTVHTKYFV